jgi:hypothetical protein
VADHYQTIRRAGAGESASVIQLEAQRETRRVTFEPWLCDGTLKDGPMKGRPCRRVLMELDYERPAAIKKVCERCGHHNVHVEAYRPSH